MEAKPDAVSITTRYPQNEGVEVAGRYTIHVPHGARVEHIGTVNGTLRIAGVDSWKICTRERQYRVFEAGGSIHAHTINGNVRLKWRIFPIRPARRRKLPTAPCPRCPSDMQRTSKPAA